MADKVYARVNPALITWARQSAGLTVDQAAGKLDISPGRLEEWELGIERFSIPQLRKLAGLYKRPLAVFYLPNPPDTFQALRDFRRLPASSLRVMPPAIILEHRRARQRRELAIELASELGDELQPFTAIASLQEPPHNVGNRIRGLLGITSQEQKSWRDADGRTAFNHWRERIESLGILVFQSDKFTSDEACGFAIAEPVAPVIVITRKNTPFGRRTFGMLHELAHILLRASGVSDLDAEAHRPPEEQQIEIYCNAVAAATILPEADLLNHATVLAHQVSSDSWSDAELIDIARTFGMSREMILRRLMTFGRTSRIFYQESRERFQQEWEESVTRKTEQPKGEMRRNMPVETFVSLGAPLIRMILETYHMDRLSLSEVAGYLGVKTKHISSIEHLSGVR